MVTASERVGAACALLLGAAAIVSTIDFAVERFPGGLVVVALFAAAAALGWFGLLRTGRARVLGFSAAVLMLVFALIFVIHDGIEQAQFVLIIVAVAGCTFAASRAFSIRVPLPRAKAPSNPVLFYNPRSGDGKAEKFALVEEAKARGIRPIELKWGDDLWELVRNAVADGADGLAMAGGDGSQAVVAAVASEEGLPYACIPAGTRNHFALDLGVDRDDVVGALDAFVNAGERKVDLAEINGRVFVNNVSLGVYAEAVQRDGYREAKLRTILDTVPDLMGPGADAPLLHWTSPSGKQHDSGAAILVSNNKYRLGRAIGSGTRPKIDDGKLGIAILADPASGGRRMRSFQKPWRDWSAPEFEVGSDGAVPAGIDGEAAQLEPPLKFQIRPGVLRVRIARQHPGASPSASIPEGFVSVTKALFTIAFGSQP